MRISQLLVIVVLALITALTYAETTPASGSSIRIKKIQPTIAQPLKPGEKVTFIVDLNYNLAAELGGAALVIQRAESGYVPLAHTYTNLSQGSGTVTLQAEVEIPATSAIQIYTPLYHQGGGSTSVVDNRVFEVVTP